MAQAHGRGARPAKVRRTRNPSAAGPARRARSKAGRRPPSRPNRNQRHVHRRTTDRTAGPYFALAARSRFVASDVKPLGRAVAASCGQWWNWRLHSVVGAGLAGVVTEYLASENGHLSEIRIPRFPRVGIQSETTTVRDPLLVPCGSGPDLLGPFQGRRTANATPGITESIAPNEDSDLTTQPAGSMGP